MARLSITKTVAEAYQDLFTHLNDWFGLAIVPVAVVSSLGVGQLYLSSWLGGLPGLLIGVVLQVVAAAFSASVYIVWIRAVQCRFAAIAPMSPLKPGPTEQKFLLTAIVLMVVPTLAIALIFGAKLAAVSIDPAVGNADPASALHGSALLTLLVAIAVLFVSVRLAFYFVDLALGRDRPLGAAFAETAGVGWGIFGAVLLALVPVGIATMFLSSLILGLFGLSMAAIIILQVASAFVSAFGAALSAGVAVRYHAAHHASGR